MKKDNYLELVPCISQDLKWKNNNGEVTIQLVHKGFFAWIAHRFFGRPRVSDISLDRFGSFVFEQINGEREIIEIGILVHDRFGKEAEPLYERLARYMFVLKRHGFIKLIKKK